jgi:hypothetical protein
VGVLPNSRVRSFGILLAITLIGGCTCMWNFFGFGHGKGPHHGVDVVLKHFIRQVQLDV